MERFAPDIFRLSQNSSPFTIQLARRADGQTILVPVQITIANTPSLIEKVCRFRYQVYIKEMNRGCKADALNEMIREDFDDAGVIFAALEGDEVVGTVRGTLSDTSSFEYPDLFDFQRFESQYPGQLMFVGKMMVSSNFRCSSLFGLLACQLYSYGLHRKTKVAILDCNDHLLGTFSKLGFKPYKEKIEHPEYGEVTPMALVLEDRSGLAEVPGPFLKMYDFYKTNIEREEKDVQNDYVSAG